MTSHGYKAAVINPIQAYASRDIWTVRKVKTDALDAATIAGLVRHKRYDSSALGDETTGELSNLARYRMSLTERSKALKNREATIFDRTPPELADPPSSAYCPTHREQLQHCATPDQVLDTDVRTLKRILGEASCGAVRTSQGRAAQSAHQETRGRRIRLQNARLQGAVSDEGTQLRAKSDQGGRKGAVCLLERTRGKWLVTIPDIDVALSGVLRKLMGVALAVMKRA